MCLLSRNPVGLLAPSRARLYPRQNPEHECTADDAHSPEDERESCQRIHDLRLLGLSLQIYAERKKEATHAGSSAQTDPIYRP